MTMATPFKIEVAGLTAFQLVILGTIMEITIFTCEVPTGVVADVVSRRLSVIIGCMLFGVGFAVMAAAPIFWAQAVAAVIWGVGETFISGAREAWVADELTHAEGEHMAAGDVFVYGTQAGFLGRFVGTWAAAAFVFWGLAAPIYAGAVGFVLLGFFLIRYMPEKGFERSAERVHSFESMRRTLAGGFHLMRTRALLAFALGATFVVGLSSEGFDRLWQKLVIDEFGLPSLGAMPEATWWAILNSAGLLTSAWAVGFIRKRVDMESQSAVIRASFWIFALLAIFLLLFGLSGSFWVAIVGFLIVRTLRRSIEPLNTAWLNLNAESKVRATVLSFSGQAHSIGEITGGPGIGAVAEFVHIRWAMFLSSALASPGPLLVWKALMRQKKEEQEPAVS